LFIERILLSWNDHPEDEVDQDTRHTTWDERNDQCQAEPERTDAEEFSKSATDTSYDAIAFGSAQSPFLIGCHFFNSFVDNSIQYTEVVQKSSMEFCRLVLRTVIK